MVLRDLNALLRLHDRLGEIRNSNTSIVERVRMMRWEWA